MISSLEIHVENWKNWKKNFQKFFDKKFEKKFRKFFFEFIFCNFPKRIVDSDFIQLEILFSYLKKDPFWPKSVIFVIFLGILWIKSEITQTDDFSQPNDAYSHHHEGITNPWICLVFMGHFFPTFMIFLPSVNRNPQFPYYVHLRFLLILPLAEKNIKILPDKVS